jgi:hypothetical protein
MIVASGHQSEAHKVNARPPKQPAAGHCAAIFECGAFCQVVIPAKAGIHFGTDEFADSGFRRSPNDVSL